MKRPAAQALAPGKKPERARSCSRSRSRSPAKSGGRARQSTLAKWTKPLKEGTTIDVAEKQQATPTPVRAVPRGPGLAAAAGQRDGPLWASIEQSTLPQEIFTKLENDGFAVLRSVLDHREAASYLSLMWDFVEKVNPAVNRNESSSWASQGKVDPWPHNMRDMFQFHQAGWLFGDLREVLAKRVFEPLYGTKELHSSKDGFCFQRPTRKPLSRRSIDHFDQSGQKKGLHCIQASVALLDQEMEDGCFLCWPGSHKKHTDLAASATKDWYILSDADKAALQKAECQPRRVPVNRGDVILWRSDLAHQGGSPMGIRTGFRAVVYICMMPATYTPEPLYAKKREAFDKLETGSHWPTKEEWFRPSQFSNRSFKAQPFFQTPPQLSQRLQELYGLKRYGES